MRFAFDEDQVAFRDAVADLLAKECPPEVVRAAWDEAGDGTLPDLWAALGGMGVLGISTSEERGGLGMGPLDWVLPIEETGRAALPGPLVETVAVGIPLLDGLGGDAADAWVPPVAAGTARLAVGLADAPWVLDAASADVLVLAHGHDLHVLPAADVSCTPQRSVDRSRRLATVDWTPTTGTLVASGSTARDTVAAAHDAGALGTAAQLCGLAARMLADTVEYTKVREQFGKPIGTQQALKHKLADVLVALEFARPLVYRAAWCLHEREPDAGVAVAAAKVAANDAALLAARHALQCHGAIGYTYEFDLQLFLKRAWALARAWGDTGHHTDRVADAVVG